MISEMKQAIVNKLQELYPTYPIYMDDVPQSLTKPAFIIFLIEQEYKKRINSKYTGRIRFDVSYYSDKPTAETKLDSQTVQENLFREFDLMGTFRAINKKSEFVDNVLHFTFDIKYSEMKVEMEAQMKSQTTNTNI
jgi:hypothetical protein